MSRGINKVIIIGNLGQDPDIRYSQDGTCFATLSVATDESYTDKQTNQKIEQTEWHRCVANARLAEICKDYLKKGSKVYIEGRLKTRKWQDQQGQDRYTTEIRIREMQMLDSKGDNQAPQQQYAQPQQRQPQQQATQQRPQQQAPQQKYAKAGDDFDDLIPF